MEITRGDGDHGTNTQAPEWRSRREHTQGANYEHTGANSRREHGTHRHKHAGSGTNTARTSTNTRCERKNKQKTLFHVAR
ncbi:hypothetical protein SUGI_0084120 [Cryptomeria japonica]|nr:hypothetical protein SUGI_0084120 [Cryptomeria japonica]